MHNTHEYMTYMTHTKCMTCMTWKDINQWSTWYTKYLQDILHDINNMHACMQSCLQVSTQKVHPEPWYVECSTKIQASWTKQRQHRRSCCVDSRNISRQRKVRNWGSKQAFFLKEGFIYVNLFFTYILPYFHKGFKKPHDLLRAASQVPPHTSKGWHLLPCSWWKTSKPTSSADCWFFCWTKKSSVTLRCLLKSGLFFG